MSGLHAGVPAQPAQPAQIASEPRMPRPAGGADRRADRARSRLPGGRLLTLAAGLGASVPVLVACARALHEGWQPVADRGIIATRAFDVFSSHMPLVGQYSYAGNVTGRLTYSLGPMLYWLLAPAAHIGAPASLALTMAVVNVASIVGAVALSRRRGGRWLMLATAVAIGLCCRSLAAENFYDIWNPSAALLPLTLLIFVCWSLACGEYRLLPLAALLASFCAQCEDAFIPPTAGLLVVALVGLALRRRLVNRWALAALAVTAVCWAAPVVDQVDHGGNLGLVLRAASERKSSLGLHVGGRALVRAIGVPPWWLERPASPWERKTQVRRPVSAVAAATALVLLAWLLLAFALALRRRRGEVAAAVAVALVLCAALVALASATPTKPLLAETLGYTLWWASPAGMFVWLAAGFAAVALAAERLAIGARTADTHATGEPAPARWLRGWPALAREHALELSLAGLAVVALAAATSAASGRPDEHDNDFPALASINSRLGAIPRGHTVLLNAQLDGIITPLRPEITFALRRRGVRALGTGAYLRLGLWYEKYAHPYDYVAWIYDHGSSPLPGARQIVRTRLDSGGVRHTITLVLAPVSALAAHTSPSGARAPRAGATRSPAATRGAPATFASRAWSAPATIARGCGLVGTPQIAFPSEGPSLPTGRGALLWARTSGGCAATPAQRASLELSAATVTAGDRAASARATTIAGAFSGQLAAVGASYGRVAIAAGLLPGGASAGANAALLQARSGQQPRAPAVRMQGLPLSLARAYLGDTAVASATPGAILVRVERHYEHGFAAPRSIAIAAGAVTALVATMDFRSDVLLAWQQNGSVYAHMLRASGRVEPTQRLGASAPDPQLQALVSDNDHGMVAWSTRAGPGAGAGAAAARTRVFVDLSQAGVRFTAPRLLASFEDPAGAGESPGSLQLVRLSSENVVMAWTELQRGHYVVRSVPPVFAARRPSTLLSDPRRQSVLAALAPGPAGEAVALWTSSTTGTADALAPRPQLWAARTFVVPGDRVGERTPEAIASAGAGAAAQIAIDPSDDRALAAWLTPPPTRAVRYSVSRGAVGYRPHGPPAAATAASAPVHWLRITLAALAAVAALILVALLWRARRGRDGGGAPRTRARR